MVNYIDFDAITNLARKIRKDELEKKCFELVPDMLNTDTFQGYLTKLRQLEDLVHTNFSASFQRVNALSDTFALLRWFKNGKASEYKYSEETNLINIGNSLLRYDNEHPHLCSYPRVLFLANESFRFKDLEPDEKVWVLGLGTYRWYTDPRDTRPLQGAPLTWMEFRIAGKDPIQAPYLVYHWLNRWLYDRDPFENSKDSTIRKKSFSISKIGESLDKYKIDLFSDLSSMECSVTKGLEYICRLDDWTNNSKGFDIYGKIPLNESNTIPIQSLKEMFYLFLFQWIRVFNLKEPVDPKKPQGFVWVKDPQLCKIKVDFNYAVTSFITKPGKKSSLDLVFYDKKTGVSVGV